MPEHSTEVRVRWVRLHDQATASYSVSSVSMALRMSVNLRESPLFEVYIETREITPWRMAEVAEETRS